MSKKFFEKALMLLKDTWQEKVGEITEDVLLFDKPFKINTKIFQDSFDLKKKHKNIKKFHVSNFELIPSELEILCLGAYVNYDNFTDKVEFNSEGSTGLYLVEFSERGKVVGHAIYIAYMYSEGGIVNDIVMTTKELYTRFIESFEKRKSKPGVPKIGIFSGYINGDGLLQYKEEKHISKPKGFTIHPAKEEIIAELDLFFSKIELYNKLGENGQQKAIIAGPPGTGKSSMLMEIAALKCKTHNICFFTDINALAQHCIASAKVNIPTIAILEDGEGALKNAEGPVLNWLNGYSQPQSKAGIYVFITTNNPDQIANRIKKRPGRIDEIFTVGNLEGEYAFLCAKQYLQAYMPEETDYEPFKGIFDDLTGAQIQLIVKGMLKIALRQVDTLENVFKHITPEFAKEVIIQLKDKYKKMDDIEQVEDQFFKTKSIGYNKFGGLK